MRPLRTCTFYLAIALLAFWQHHALGADITAIWSGNGLWSDATNWSSDPDIPNNTTTTYDAVISSGTVTADVPNVIIDGLTLDGGLLRGAENITVTTSGSWSEQRILDSVGITVDTGATFDITGNDSSKELEDTASFTVRGTVNLSGTGGVRTSGGAATDVTINIEAGGLFDIQSDANLTGEFGASLYRKGTLNNAGMLKKTAGAGISVIDGNWNLQNTGSLIVESGTLQFSNFNFGNTFNNDGSAVVQAGTLQFGNGTSTGTFDIQSGANMTTTSTLSGQQVFDGAQITNAGTLVLDGNTHFTNGATYTGAGGVTVASGTLSGDSALTFPDLNWTGGRINSTGGIVVPAAGLATASGSNAKQLGDASTLTIEGTFNVASTSNIDTLATTVQPAKVNIAATGTLDFQSDAGLDDGNINFDSSRAGALTVDGTLRKSAGTQTTTVSKNWTVANNGTVDTQSGIIAFEGSVSGAGSYTGTGTVAFEGEFSPGNSPAKIDFSGDVQFGTDATLTLEIGGTVPGTDFDVLDIDGTASLVGDLDVSLINSFQPVLGDSFEIINAATSLTGTFSTAALPVLTDTQLAWDVVYDTNTLTLEVVSAALADADFNEDTFVDGSDLSTWLTNYSNSGTSDRSTGDTDLDMDTDGTDFLTWQRQYTGPPATPSAQFAAVPEPSSILLISTGAAISFLTVRRQTDLRKGGSQDW